MIRLFKMMQIFLRNEYDKNKNKNYSSAELLQNIILNIGKNYSLILLRNGNDGNEIKYDTKCEIALYEFESVAFKHRVTLCDLLKGIIKMKSKKWTCDKSEIINNAISHF